MSGLEELYGNDAETNEPVVETPAAESVAAPAPQAEPVVQVEAPLVETPAPVAEPQAAPPQNLDAVGLLRALQEERDSRQAAQRKANELEAREAARARKLAEQAAQAPDILEDPQAYIEWAERREQERVQKAVAAVQTQQVRAVETLSRNMLVRHIGAEKVAEVEEFSRSAPKRAVDEAYASGDPYGWFFEKFEAAQKHRKAQEAAKQLESFGGKSLAEIIAEERAKWEAENGAAPSPVITAPADTRARNNDGTFAPQPTQRHTPESLAAVNGSAVIAGSGASGSALEELYNN
jgi:hypothetical protein